MDAQSRLVAKLMRRVSDLERRLENGIRHGTVKQVDAEKHQCRLVIGLDASGSEQLSPWIKYGQVAGDYKFHNPPSVGQTMTLLSPGGDFTQAVAVPLTWSNQNKSPSDKPDEHVVTFGDLKITRRKKEMILEVGKTKIHFRPDDKDELHVSVDDKQTLRVHPDGIEAIAEVFKHTGQVVRHNELDIGDTHKHRDVMTGPNLTGLPIPASGGE